MRDLPPMPPCTSEKMKHDLVPIGVGEDGTAQGVRVALFCCDCGAVRLFSLSEQRSGALDDMDAEQIERIAKRARK